MRFIYILSLAIAITGCQKEHCWQCTKTSLHKPTGNSTTDKVTYCGKTKKEMDKGMEAHNFDLEFEKETMTCEKQ